ncbi:MAG: EAL domain-containing response regulator [Myxococcales bacterium]|nr:EAL domain-containing response regulator [Myxococcales bacterium]
MTEELIRGRLLLVEDDDLIRHAYARGLAAGGFEVDTARDGLEAREKIEHTRYDAIVSDVAMPGLDGLGLLREVRRFDLDVPVVLITGGVTETVAEEAVAAGAMLCLQKPIQLATLQQIVRHAARLHALARLKRWAVDDGGPPSHRASDRAGLEVRFDSALARLWIAFQPIVLPAAERVVAYEALMRSDETAMPHPGALLDAAQRLGRTRELSRAVRAKVAEQLAGPGRGLEVFVNIHADDLTDATLLAADEPLAPFARQVVLEVTERAPLDEVRELSELAVRLRQRGYRLAVDDLGAGYAGLTAVARLQPDVVKLDMTLVRGLGESEVKRTLVRGMARLCRDLGMRVVCEGVETAAERDTLMSIDCDCQQGYLFARPARGFPAVGWGARAAGVVLGRMARPEPASTARDRAPGEGPGGAELGAPVAAAPAVKR